MTSTKMGRMSNVMFMRMQRALLLSGVVPVVPAALAVLSGCDQDPQFEHKSERAPAQSASVFPQSEDMRQADDEDAGFDGGAAVPPVNVAGANLVGFECRTLPQNPSDERVACLSSWSRGQSAEGSRLDWLADLSFAVLTESGESVAGVWFSSVELKGDGTADPAHQTQFMHYSDPVPAGTLPAEARVEVLFEQREQEPLAAIGTLYALEERVFEQQPQWGAAQIVSQIERAPRAYPAQAHASPSRSVTLDQGPIGSGGADALAAVELPAGALAQLCASGARSSGRLEVDIPALGSGCVGVFGTDDLQSNALDLLSGVEKTRMKVTAPSGTVICGLDVRFITEDFEYDAAVQFNVAGQTIARSFAVVDDSWEALANRPLPPFEPTCASSATACEMKPGSDDEKIDIRASLDLSARTAALSQFDLVVSTYSVAGRACSRSGLRAAYQYRYVRLDGN